MAEIDPVVLELRAEVGKYRAELKSTTSLVSQSLGQQEKSVQRLEAQMKRSSGAIGGQIKGLAAAFAGAFTGRELVGLIDGFTRLQNSLRVAGLEGQNLERVQSQLLELSSKYGVGIEGLADLFGKTSQTANELGASQQQLIQLTEASSQALKITGTSAQQAQGALLGLTQALASGKVRAEEFNQINEGGLRPLLQVIANTDRFGGSVAKLRQAVNDGKVSSQEFFQAILGGAQELDAKASKATLTLAGAVEALTSRMTVYVGSASSAKGVTGALAGAISALADNLDVVIPALAAIATALSVGFVTNAIAARVAALSAATAMGTLSASAAFAGRAMLAAFGGPVGIAITALIATLGIASTRTTALARASDNLKRSHEAVASAASQTASLIDRLATSYGDARVKALALADAQKKILIGKTILALSDLDKAEKNAAAARRNTGRYSGAIDQQTQDDLKVARDNLTTAAGALRDLERAIAAPPPKPPAVGTSGDGKKPKKGGGSSGNAAADRAAQAEARAAQELFNLEIEELRARAQLVTNAEDRADFERQILGKERDAREADIAAAVKSGDLTAKQAEEQRQILDLLYGKRNSEAKDGEILVESTKSLYGIAIERERQRQAEQDAADLADAAFRAQSDALRDQYDLARSQAERRDLALKIVAAEYDHLEAVQEAIIASKTATDAEKERARIILASLPSSRAAATERAQKDTQGPLEQYFDRARLDAQQLNEAYQQIAVDGLQSFTDGIADAIVNAKNLGDVFKNVAKQIIADLIRIAIQQQIVNALQSSLFSFGGLFSSASAGVGSAGSALGSAIGKIPGRASGGPVEAGRLYRINESGMEGFVPATSGTIIPAGQMNAIASRGGGSQQPIELRIYADEGGTFVPRVEAISAGVSVRVQQQAAPVLIDAAANETLRRANRPKV